MERIGVYALLALGAVLLVAGYELTTVTLDGNVLITPHLVGVAGYIALVLAGVKAIDLRSGSSR